MQIALELPNEFVALESPMRVQQEAQSSYALWLYQQGRVTLAKAAQLAGLDLYDFMGVCKLSHVPVIDVSPEELRQELDALDAS